MCREDAGTAAGVLLGVAGVWRAVGAEEETRIVNVAARIASGPTLVKQCQPCRLIAKPVCGRLLPQAGEFGAGAGEAGGAGDDRYVFDVDSTLGSDTISESAGGGSDTLDFQAVTSAVDLLFNLPGGASLLVSGGGSSRIASERYGSTRI